MSAQCEAAAKTAAGREKAAAALAVGRLDGGQARGPADERAAEEHQPVGDVATRVLVEHAPQDGGRHEAQKADDGLGGPARGRLGLGVVGHEAPPASAARSAASPENTLRSQRPWTPGTEPEPVCCQMVQAWPPKPFVHGIGRGVRV